MDPLAHNGADNRGPERLRSRATPRACKLVRWSTAGASTGWACLLLAALGLGGGLSLAFFSFNSPDTSPRITGIAPEVIYQRPHAATPLLADAGESSSRVNETAGATHADPTIAAFSEVRPPSELETFNENALELPLARAPVVTLADSGFIGGSFQPGTDIHAMTNGAGEPSSGTGSDAVMIPVPEPSMWALLLSGAAVAVAALRRRKSTKAT